MKKLKSKAGRYGAGLFIAEGISIAREIVNCCPERIKYVFVTEGVETDFDISSFECFEVTDSVMECICETKTPQGMAVCVEIKKSTANLEELDFIVYLDHIQDPGNAGTIIRTADAAGVQAVVMSPESVDIYNSKTVRSTMGSMFHINVFYEDEYLETLKALKASGFVISAGDLSAEKNIYETDFGEKSVICLGNEAHGISDELLEMDINKVIIPIEGKAESLNVGVAGAIFMYEILRRRKFK
ncbi:MAG: RNA methyltransferase [Clostridia bacterium]|nr:RNA methyltransferase [Clostridia bacterium]